MIGASSLVMKPIDTTCTPYFSAGTIFWQGEEPKIHCHGTYGRGDSVKAGCLREGTESFLVLEAVVTEILDVAASRELDPVSGMVLLKLSS